MKLLFEEQKKFLSHFEKETAPLFENQDIKGMCRGKRLHKPSATGMLYIFYSLIGAITVYFSGFSGLIDN